MATYVVAPTAEIPPGTRRVVELGGREIGIFNIDGEYFAVRNRCPHQAGPLCTGAHVGLLSSGRPGEYIHSVHGEMIQCPWHQWEFDVRTGRSWFDPEKVRARAYSAHVEDGAEVLEHLGIPAGAKPDESGKIPGPYTAEVYPVTVDEDYVVVEVR